MRLTTTGILAFITLEICGFKGGCQERTIKADNAHGLAYSADGDAFLSRGQIWDAKTGKELRKFYAGGHDAVFFGKSNLVRTIDCGGAKAKSYVRLWNWKIEGLYADLEVSRVPLPEGAYLGRFSADGDRLALGYWVDLTDVTAKPPAPKKHRFFVQHYSCDAGKLEVLFQGEAGLPKSFAFAPRGDLLAVGMDNGDVRIWDLTAKKELLQFRAATSAVVGLAFSPDQKKIACGQEQRDVCIWDITTAKKVLDFESDAYENTCLQYTLDGEFLLIGQSRHLQVWSAADGKQVARWYSTTYAPILSMAQSPDGKKILTGSGAGITVWARDKLVPDPTTSATFAEAYDQIVPRFAKLYTPHVKLDKRLLDRIAYPRDPLKNAQLDEFFKERDILFPAAKENMLAGAWLALRLGPDKVPIAKELTGAMLADVAAKLLPVRFRSEPEGAEVYLYDGAASVGPAPRTRFVPAGRLQVVMKLKGYADYRAEVTISEANQQVVGRLEKVRDE